MPTQSAPNVTQSADARSAERMETREDCDVFCLHPHVLRMHLRITIFWLLFMHGMFKFIQLFLYVGVNSASWGRAYAVMSLGMLAEPTR